MGMSFAAHQGSRKKTIFNGIPSTRRHVYFYLLLFLSTAVAHNIWKNCQTDAPRPEAEQAHEIVASVHKLSR